MHLPAVFSIFTFAIYISHLVTFSYSVFHIFSFIRNYGHPMYEILFCTVHDMYKLHFDMKKILIEHFHHVLASHKFPTFQHVSRKVYKSGEDVVEKWQKWHKLVKKIRAGKSYSRRLRDFGTIFSLSFFLFDYFYDNSRKYSKLNVTHRRQRHRRLMWNVFHRNIFIFCLDAKLQTSRILCFYHKIIFSKTILSRCTVDKLVLV
jgi:hypothetical protein